MNDDKKPGTRSEYYKAWYAKNRERKKAMSRERYRKLAEALKAQRATEAA